MGGMAAPSPSELPLPTEAIPSLKTLAEVLSARLGRRLNYAHVYVVLSSARASGDLDAIGCQDFLEHTANPRLIETLVHLLGAHPELIDELQGQKKLQGFE